MDQLCPARNRTLAYAHVDRDDVADLQVATLSKRELAIEDASVLRDVYLMSVAPCLPQRCCGELLEDCQVAQRGYPVHLNLKYKHDVVGDEVREARAK